MQFLLKSINVKSYYNLSVDIYYWYSKLAGFLYHLVSGLFICTRPTYVSFVAPPGWGRAASRRGSALAGGGRKRSTGRGQFRSFQKRAIRPVHDHQAPPRTSCRGRTAQSRVASRQGAAGFALVLIRKRASRPLPAAAPDSTCTSLRVRGSRARHRTPSRVIEMPSRKVATVPGLSAWR